MVYKEHHPNATLVTITVGRDVPMQRVVATLDALRNCTMDDAIAEDDDIPSSCLLWQPLVSDGS